MGTIAQDSESLHVNAAPNVWPIAPEKRTGRFDRALNLIEALWDGLVSAGAVVAAIAVKQHFQFGVHIHYSPGTAMLAGTLCGAFFVLLLDHDGAYRGGNSLLQIKETERVLRVSTLAMFLAVLLLYAAGCLVPRLLIGVGFVFVVISLTAAKQLFYVVIQNLRARGLGVQEVVIYGSGYSGRRVFSALARSPKLGLVPVAIVDDDPNMEGQEIFEPGYRRDRSLRVSRGPITSDLLRWYNAKVLVIAIPSLASDQFSAAVKAAEEAGAGLALMPRLNREPKFSLDFMEVDGLMLVSFSEKQARAVNDVLKRVLDLTVASLSLLALSPLFALIALLVRFDSPGPILFVQERVGKDGRLFSLYKFRSMHLHAPSYACSPDNVDDPRITRVGRYLRRTSLDELPQLINVIKGEMSLVGPRPEMPFLVNYYTSTQRQRLSVLPGITGLWQLSADRAFPIHENVLYDLYYIRYRGFFLDLAVLFHTLVFAMKGI
jgi:exopolysaccharide biosynthesis polyprenyl glycosylphosphotransferase